LGISLIRFLRVLFDHHIAFAYGTRAERHELALAPKDQHQR
jgi:hypothetical protein